MSLTGDPDGPPTKAGSAMADTVAGTFAFAGILAALLHRYRSGEGQHVDVSMVDCLLALVLDESPDVWRMLGLPGRQGNRIPRVSRSTLTRPRTGGSPPAVPRADWSRLLDAIERADVKGDAHLVTPAGRIANNGRVDAIVAAWTRERRPPRRSPTCARTAWPGVPCATSTR